MDSQRCADVTAQIEQARADYTDTQVLLPGAEPCELSFDSFDPRTSRDSVEYLLGAFSNACQTQAEACSGVPTRDRPDPDLPPEPVGPPPAPPPYFRPPEQAFTP